MLTSIQAGYGAHHAFYSRQMLGFINQPLLLAASPASLTLLKCLKRQEYLKLSFNAAVVLLPHVACGFRNVGVR